MNKKQMIKISLFVALTAIFSQILIPIGLVPINLAVLSVFICGGLLDTKSAVLSQIVYILLGLIGVPVFSGFGAGFGKLFGPTGGYIWGYIVCAFIVSIVIGKFESDKMYIISGGMVVGLVGCYMLGTAWFMYTTGNGLIQSLMLCVIPFLFGDALKIAVATIIIKRLRNKV